MIVLFACTNSNHVKNALETHDMVAITPRLAPQLAQKDLVERLADGLDRADHFASKAWGDRRGSQR